jgi:hypothetical protein
MDETPDHVPTPNTSISGLYQACQESVLKYCQDRTNNTNSLIKILGSALHLHRFSKATQEAGAELNQLVKDKGIRKIKRTENYFTPIVKLIFDGEVREKEKSLVMRCASTLRLADSMGIDSDGIAAFVDEQGGIVQCYKLDREMHQAAATNVPGKVFMLASWQYAAAAPIHAADDNNAIRTAIWGSSVSVGGRVVRQATGYDSISDPHVDDADSWFLTYSLQSEEFSASLKSGKLDVRIDGPHSLGSYGFSFSPPMANLARAVRIAFKSCI